MVDDVVGQVREALQRNGIDSNTIVVFTTDNGCSPAGGIPEMAAKGHHANYIWRGMKATSSTAVTACHHRGMGQRCRPRHLCTNCLP